MGITAEVLKALQTTLLEVNGLAEVMTVVIELEVVVFMLPIVVQDVVRIPRLLFV